jgi:hypothetical protein
MSQLEPTYLRFIHDGLMNGSIHKDNAADLPDGLMGLYEEAFDDCKSVVNRQTLLQRFAVWALLKKEVSIPFVAKILGETENEIQAFISTYSAWFNSPESSKYQLFHERLRVFLLQKITTTELIKINDQIISFISQINQIEDAQYYVNYGYLHYWLAQTDDLNDHRFKQLYLRNDYLKLQYEKLLEYTPIYNGINLAISYYSFKKDEIVSELVKKALLISSKESDRLKILYSKNAIDIQIYEIQKIKDYSYRYGDIESYFQLLIFLISELTLEKTNAERLYDYIVLEIQDYLLSQSIPLDFYIPLINLVFLVEFDETRTSKLLFLFNHIYSYKLLNHYDIIDQNALWAKFHHENTYRNLEEKHIDRFYWIKNNKLPNNYDSILFILDIWENINQKQREIIINNITAKDILLIMKGGIVFAIKRYFIDILYQLILKDKIQKQFINDFYYKILETTNKSHFKTCQATIHYLKSELFDGLNEVDKHQFCELFLKIALRIKINKSFDIILNEIANRTNLIHYFDIKKYINTASKRRINKIKYFNKNTNNKGFNKYFFNSHTIIDNLKESIDYSFNDIDNITPWVLNNIYYLALKSDFDGKYLKNKIHQIQNTNSNDYHYLLEDLELVQLITQIENNPYESKLIDLIKTISFPPNKEVLYAQIMMSTEVHSINLIESIRRNSPKRNETDKNLLNRAALSLGLALKDKNLLKRIRIIDYELATEYNLSYHHLFRFNEILELPIDDCVKFLYENYERIFDGQINENIFTEYFKLINNQRKDNIIESLFTLSSEISNEFDSYLLRSTLFELNYKYSDYFDLKKWNARIEEYDHPYWKADAYSRVIDYFLYLGDIKSANFFYEKHFPSDNSDYSKIIAWRNIIRYYIKTRNFNLALTLFNGQTHFPDPEYFPSEDELKFQIFISPENTLYFKVVIEFLTLTIKDLKFIDKKYKENLQIILDFIRGDYDFLEFLDNYKSILGNWYNFDIDEIFELAILQKSRFEVLKVLKNSKIKMREYYINLLFRNIQKIDLIDHPIYDWMIEIPRLVNLHSIIAWHNFLSKEK